MEARVTVDTIAATDLITAWEQGQARSLAGRSHSLLALLGVDPARRGNLSVGQRDALLMDLRGQLFGTQVVSMATCPACGERLELAFALDEVRVSPPGDPVLPLDLEHDGFAIRARPPTVADLEALDAALPDQDRRSLLLARCVEAARKGNRLVPVDRLPETVVTHVAATLAKADPQADIQLALQCPACGHGWTAVFDIVSFLWIELDAWSRRLLRQVHALASAYGWREVDILAMSSWRRAAYLELLAS